MNKNNYLISKQNILSYVYLLKWILCALMAGITGSMMVHLFHYLITSLSSVLHTQPVPLWVWPSVGAVLAGGIIYRIESHAAGEGLPSYIKSLRFYNSHLPFSVTFYKFWAALVTLATGGNGGIVGPLGRVSAGIMGTVFGSLTKKCRFWNEDDRRTAVICGLAATVGTVFHTSIGGGIFAVEIIQKAKMGYRDLFPAILSSASAVFFCKIIGWESYYMFDAVDEFMDISLIGWLAFLSIIAGAIGGGYTILYGWIARLFGRKKGNVLIKVILGSLLSGVLTYVINPELLGTSRLITKAIFSADMHLLSGTLTDTLLPVEVILIVMLLTKAVCNCITVGCGMSAGFTGPAVIIGMLIGMTMAQCLNIEVGTASFHVFLAVGFCAMIAGSMNVPLAAAVMTVELFGLQYSFPAGFSAVIGFQVMRHRTIYDYAVNETTLPSDLHSE